MNPLLAPDGLPALLQDPNEAAAYRQRRFANPTHGQQGEGIAAYILRNLAEGMATLPERAIRAAGDLQRGGEYDAGPAVEAALLTMGGTAAGAPKGAVGAGPARGLYTSAPTETIRAAAIRSKEGKVFEGTTHGDAATNLFSAKHQLHPTEAGDGFVTSTGRFVDRAEATKIALREKQTYDPEFALNRGADAWLHARDLRPSE